MAKKAGLIWIDAAGEKVLHVITTQSGVGAIETALENHSQAGVVECWEGFDENSAVSPGSAVYATIRVTAILTYLSSLDGSTARLYIPSPTNNIFLSDGRTVDPSAITDITLAAFANLTTGTGQVVDTFLGGQLIGTRFSGLTTIP